jgi:hypothetical protein
MEESIQLLGYDFQRYDATKCVKGYQYFGETDLMPETVGSFEDFVDNPIKVKAVKSENTAVLIFSFVKLQIWQARKQRRTGTHEKQRDERA